MTYVANVASPLSATATDLTWNFADPGSGKYADLVFEDTSSNNFVAWYNYDFSGPVTTNAYGNTQTSGSYGQPQSGPVVFGSFVPEPGSLVLVVSGLAGLFAVRRRQAA